MPASGLYTREAAEVRELRRVNGRKTFLQFGEQDRSPVGEALSTLTLDQELCGSDGGLLELPAQNMVQAQHG